MNLQLYCWARVLLTLASPVAWCVFYIWKSTRSLKLRGINPLFCMISALWCRVECTRLLHVHPPQWTWPRRNRENVKAKESSICKEQPWGLDYSHYKYLFIGFLTTPPQHPFVFQYLWPRLTTQTRWYRESKQMTTWSGSWSKEKHSRSFGLNSSGMKKAFGESGQRSQVTKDCPFLCC